MSVVEISGDYADGTSSRMEAAILSLYEDGSVEVNSVDGDSCLFLAHIDKVSVNSRLGNTPRVIQLAGDIRFITPDNDRIDEYLAAQGKGQNLIHLLESHMGMVIFSVVLTVALVGGYLASGLPYTARLVADNLPDSVVESFGAGSVELFDRIWTEPSELTEDEQLEIRALFESYVELSSTRVTRILFRSGIGPNAFALPDGTIIFTDELIQLADNDEELIAILFHEIGHLEHKHLLRRAIQDSVLTIMVVLIVGDIETADVLLGLPTLLLEFAYSRDFELEADHYALRQLKAQGIEVDHFARIMTKLQDFYSNQKTAEATETSVTKDDDLNPLENTFKPLVNYFSTHPATIERVQLIEQYR